MPVDTGHNTLEFLLQLCLFLHCIHRGGAHVQNESTDSWAMAQILWHGVQGSFQSENVPQEDFACWSRSDGSAHRPPAWSLPKADPFCQLPADQSGHPSGHSQSARPHGTFSSPYRSICTFAAASQADIASWLIPVSGCPARLSVPQSEAVLRPAAFHLWQSSSGWATSSRFSCSP